MRFRTLELVRIAPHTYGRVMGPHRTRKRLREWPIELMTGQPVWVPEHVLTSAEGRNTNEEL